MESTRPKALPAAESSTDPQDLPLRSYHLLRSSLGRLIQAVKNHWNRIMAELLVVFENSNLFSKRSAPTKDRFWHVARATVRSFSLAVRLNPVRQVLPGPCRL
jgi:hypothetical protein